MVTSWNVGLTDYKIADLDAGAKYYGYKDWKTLNDAVNKARAAADKSEKALQLRRNRDAITAQIRRQGKWVIPDVRMQSGAKASWLDPVAKKIKEYNKTKDPKVFISRSGRQLEAGSPTIKKAGFLDLNQSKQFAKANDQQIKWLSEKSGVSPTIIKNAQTKYNALPWSERRSPILTEGQLKYFDRKTAIQQDILKQIDNKVFNSKEIAKNLGMSHKNLIAESGKLFKNVYAEKLLLNKGATSTSTFLPGSISGLNKVLDKLWKVEGFGPPEAKTWFSLVRDAKEAGRLTVDQFKKATADVKNFYDMKNVIQKKYPSIILNLDHPLSRGTLTMLNAKGEKFLTGIPTTERFNKGIKEKFDVRYKNLISDVRKGVPEAANKKAALENLARELKIDIGEVSKTGRKITSLGQESVILGEAPLGESIVKGLEKQNVLAKNIKNIRPELLEAAGMDQYFKKTKLPEISARTIEGIRQLFNEGSNSLKNKTAVALGCIGKAEGGRIGYALGSSTINCVNTKLTNEPVQSSLKLKAAEGVGKIRGAATTFLGMLGRGGMKAAPYAAVAAAGALAEPLVKQFRNDDPTTYLSNPEQQKGMLLSMVEAETPKVDEEILKWQYPGIVGGAAAAIPGSGAMYKARRLNIGKPKMGMARAALGPVGKVLAGSFSPLGVAASLPIGIAAQVKGGAELEDIATDPFNWMGPAFASTGARMATRGMPATGILSKALRLGMKPSTLRMISSRFGLPGLALSAGLKGYDIWKNRE